MILTLALRNTFRQRWRAGLTLGAIALGVASLILAGGFVDDMLIQLREATIRSQLGHLQVYKEGRFASAGRQPLDFLIDTPAPIAKAVDALPEVAVRTSRLTFSALLQTGRAELPVYAEGVDPDREAVIGSAFTILHGRHLAPTDRFGILVGEGVANALKLRIGDRVNLLLNTREGAMNALDFEVSGVFRSISREYDAQAVRVMLGESMADQLEADLRQLKREHGL